MHDLITCKIIWFGEEFKHALRKAPVRCKWEVAAENGKPRPIAVILARRAAREKFLQEKPSNLQYTYKQRTFIYK